MLSPPRAILFDLDETLLSFGHRPDQIRAVVDETPDLFAPLPPESAVEVIEAAFRAHWADQARHRAWRAKPLIEARRHIARDAFAALERHGCINLTDDAAVAFGDRFHAYRETQITLYPDALEILAAFRDRGLRLALVTNGAAQVQRPKIERFGLAGLFDHIQIEGEHGFGKPEPRAYHHALEKVGAAAHETWMVGDNLEWEVIAPQRIGVHAIWFDPRGAGLPPDSPARPDRIIKALSELLD
ncbi:MAG: HAD family hydrolase [Caulobacteraceae bacterium]|nr:HAD family hydrolase [Caulobacteraceae bacterium]